MKLEINNYRRIFAIQKEFNTEYPNLTLEFYERPGKSNGATTAALVKSNNKNLSACRAANTVGYLSISPEMSYGELKRHFIDEYSLSIALFRKNRATLQNVAVSDNDAALKELNDFRIPAFGVTDKVLAKV
jgi:hypothetical protein